MQALAAQNQPPAALAQYVKCCEILQSELGVEPAPETQAIAQRLRAGRSVTPAARHNLPRQSKSIIGRDAEIVHVHEVVQTERLVTLLGIGGVGKSRLAQAVAQRAVADFGDGVWFVSLVNVEPGEAAPDRIALAIAAAIGSAVTDLHDPLAEVAAHLADKHLLLVLDNWDHLADAAEFVIGALLGVANVHILATSRVQLLVEGEIPVWLEGLPANAALALFLERARRIVPSIASSANVNTITPAIYKICSQVAGLPLGIEMAASWVEHFSVAEIADSLAEMTMAPDQLGEYAERQQTLRGIFEYSWLLLTAHQQQILARLATFRGGFDRTAAAVAGCGLSDLSLLSAHSLVQRVDAGRYNLHPLVQEFAARNPPAAESVALAGKHSQHYLATLVASTHERQIESLHCRAGAVFAQL